MKHIIMIMFLFTGLKTQAQQYCCHEPGPAFDGNDITSYYDENGIQKGHPDFTYSYVGMTLIFENEENRSKFIKEPDKYFPEYGAWCAIAMSLGSIIKPNYSYYILREDGRLLFFTIQGFVNGITLWKKDPKGNKVKADTFYLSILDNE